MTRCVDSLCLDGPREDDQPRPRWATRGLLCARCAGLLERRLAEMPATADQLRAILGATGGGRGENRRTKGQPPVPLNIAAHDHLQHLAATLGSWVALAAEERGLRGPERQTPHHLSQWLLGHLDWLVQQPWVDDLSDELRDLTRTADGLTQVRPGWHRLPAPCPGCESLTLGRWDGDDAVGCATCGERWPEDAYARLVLVLAATTDQALDAAQAAHLAGVEVATIRQWVHRGRLKRLPGDGPARYAARDVEALAGGAA